ncbi:hypothetical protein ACSBOB_05830 [Mesorhizobium sp. ASY16-5R]|uniref:hypothetical protein n=1 Tax=Mesorhizobium sp. ASY16-5R TaxID=3445772 RepID=UPI003F9F2285
MTVDEFFDWQQRQDRNHKLVDGVPVLHRRPPSGSPAEHASVYARLLRSVHERGSNLPFEHDGCRTVRFPTASAVVHVISPWQLDYDAFKEISGDVFWSDTPCVLIDAEHPRASTWKTVGGARSSHELRGLDTLVELPEAGIRFTLRDLY